MEIASYSLADRELLEDDGKSLRAMVWIPPTTIVLGFSGTLEKALVVEAVQRDRIPVMRRPSGGEAVFLSPRMLCISLSRSISRIGSPYPFFRQVNERIIAALIRLGVETVAMRGISDLAIGERKILGSAIYQTRTHIFYHAVLNVKEDSRLIARYLRYPDRTPPYRQNRPHDEFITSLHAEGFGNGIDDYRRQLQAFLAAPIDS